VAGRGAFAMAECGRSLPSEGSATDAVTIEKDSLILIWFGNALFYDGCAMSQEEETELLRFDFGRLQSRGGTGVVPVAVQDAETMQVLLIAHVSKEALDETLRTGTATFWSMSRNELWVKGATSGNFLKVEEIRVNCEQNSLLYVVHLQAGGACHTKDENGEYRLGCYYRKLADGRLVPADR
jgi:phosphoribosyl-AMP cyclohydrolase